MSVILIVFVRSGLCVMETTNEVPNTELFKTYISPKTLMSWTRVMAANRMYVHVLMSYWCLYVRRAHDGKHWVEIYSKLNSGTYNNQWIVVDYNKFEPGKPLKEGLLWISEQIPGYVFVLLTIPRETLTWRLFPLVTLNLQTWLACWLWATGRVTISHTSRRSLRSADVSEYRLLRADLTRFYF